MNVQRVISLYAIDQEDNLINCQIFPDSYRFINFKINDVNTGIIESKTPLIDAKVYAKNNNMIITDRPR